MQYIPSDSVENGSHPSAGNSWAEKKGAKLNEIAVVIYPIAVTERNCL